MFKRKFLSLSLLLLCFPAAVQAADHLLYLEAQGIFGYSSAADEPIAYSMNPDAEMQKPSLGFDYLKRISGDSGDVATLALQGRLALVIDNEDNTTKVEPQVYNCYVKFKTPEPYIWLGHNRPAFGLSSYFDSHGLILRTLAVQGFGYDRDWGAGLYKDFAWGDISASVTTGSGMPIYFKDNYMTAARISYGVLSHENFNVGFSLGYGDTLDTMGYELRDPEPQRMKLAGADLTFLRNNLEHRFDFFAGKWLGEDSYGMFYRFGVNLDPEARTKIEAQPVYWKFGEENDYQLSLCVSRQITANLTTRLAYTYDDQTDDNRVMLQLYLYKPI